jgi:hypothetical protein
MKINPKQLLAAVTALLPITQKRTTLDVMRTIHIEGFGNWLTLRAMNADEFAERVIDCEGDFPPVCVNAERLATYLQHESKAEVVIEPAEMAGRLNYRGGAKASIACIAADQFPASPNHKMESIGLNCEDLADAIESVEWVLALNTKEQLTSRPWVGAANVTTSEKSMRTMATNGHMLAVNSSASICGPCCFDIMREYIPTFCAGLRAEGSDLLLGESNIGVSFKGGRWIGRLLEEKFPIEGALQMMQCDFKKVGSMMPSDLMPHLEICNSFVTTGKGFIPIRIEFEAKGALIKFNAVDADSYEYPIDGKFTPGIWKANSQELLAAVRKLNPDLPFTIKADDVKHFLSDGIVDVILADSRVG